MRRATTSEVSERVPLAISIHALLAESDAPWLARLASHFDFYPRSPCGERQSKKSKKEKRKLFLSTLSLRRATDKRCQFNGDDGFLSTLSLRRATHWQVGQKRILQFLSTLSLRRATSAPSITPTASRNFYPRSPCGERLKQICQAKIIKKFLSTLSLRRATKNWRKQSNHHKFLSTLSLRRATARRASRQQPAGISIHALLAESDCIMTTTICTVSKFLSTLSLRRATVD